MGYWADSSPDFKAKALLGYGFSKYFNLSRFLFLLSVICLFC